MSQHYLHPTNTEWTSGLWTAHIGLIKVLISTKSYVVVGTCEYGVGMMQILFEYLM